MAIQEYPVGQPVKFTITFYSDAARTVAVDPNTVQLTLNPPEGEDQVYTLVDDEIENEAGTGNFSLTATPDAPGDWKYRWESDEPVVVVQGVIHVRETSATPS